MEIIKIKNKNSHKKALDKAVFYLQKGGMIIYPTETCYGLGVDPTNSKAVDTLLKYKGERKGKPVSIAVFDLKMAKTYIKINPTAQNIFKNLLPGPITVVCEGRHKVDPRIESKQGTLGIRMPDHPIPLAIVKKFGKPITATSANISGGKTPYSIADLLFQLPLKKKELIDLIIDAGKLPQRPPSSVVDTTLNEPTLLRQGEIDFNQLNAKSIISNSEEETQKFAQKLLEKNLSALAKKPLIFALQGELGSGKTQFAKGLGKGLKITQPITSPTFTIVKEYPYKLGKIKGIFYHIDAWRIASTDKTLEFVKNYLSAGNVVAIEWIQKGKEVLEKLPLRKKVKIIWVEIKHLNSTRRQIRFTD